MDSLLDRAENIVERAKLFEEEKNKSEEGAAVAEPTPPPPATNNSEEGGVGVVIPTSTPAAPVSKPRPGGINIAAILTRR